MAAIIGNTLYPGYKLYMTADYQRFFFLQTSALQLMFAPVDPRHGLKQK